MYLRFTYKCQNRDMLTDIKASCQNQILPLTFIKLKTTSVEFLKTGLALYIIAIGPLETYLAKVNHYWRKWLIWIFTVIFCQSSTGSISYTCTNTFCPNTTVVSIDTLAAVQS